MTKFIVANDRETDQKLTDIAPEMLANVTFTSWVLAEAHMRDISYEAVIQMLELNPESMVQLQDGVQSWTIAQLAVLQRMLDLPAEEIFSVWQHAYIAEVAA